MTSSPRTRLTPAVRRVQILDAAERVVADGGWEGVTVEAVAAAAGVSRGLVHKYFGDRRDVEAALYVRELERLHAALATVDPDLPRPRRVRAMVEVYLCFARDHAAVSRCLLTLRDHDHPRVRDARAQTVNQMADTWGGGSAAVVAARATVGLLESATIGWLDDGAGDMAVTVDVATAMIVHGLEGVAAIGGASLPA